jgi:hypothetical protein
MKDYKLTTCGLSCDLCDSNITKVQDSASYLLEIFKDPMFAGIISFTNPNFNPNTVPQFKQTLNVLKSIPPCPGCQGRMDCSINQCAKEKNIDNCSKCEFIDFEQGTCNAPLNKHAKGMPPAPIFFAGITKRYQNWNIKNLKTLSEDKKEEINATIDKMIKDGKSNRDIIDYSVNLFEQMK